MSEYDVTVERTTETPTAVVKAVTTWQEFPTLWRTLLDDVWAFLDSKPGLRGHGHNVMLYRNLTDADVAVEVGVQVSEAFVAAGRVVPSTLPGGDSATTVHQRTPSEIGAAHSAIRAWCSAHRHEVTGVRWEIYGDPNPQTGHFDVAVYWQLA